MPDLHHTLEALVLAPSGVGHFFIAASPYHHATTEREEHRMNPYRQLRLDKGLSLTAIPPGQRQFRSSLGDGGSSEPLFVNRAGASIHDVISQAKTWVGER